MRAVCFTLLLCALALVGCGNVVRQTRDSSVDNKATPPATALVAQGITLYRKYYCGLCHTLSAADTTGAFGPTHNRMGIIAEQRINSSNYTGSATTAEAYIRESIVAPNRYIVANYLTTMHAMPAYTHLSDGEIDALVVMLLQQR